MIFATFSLNAQPVNMAFFTDENWEKFVDEYNVILNSGRGTFVSGERYDVIYRQAQRFDNRAAIYKAIRIILDTPIENLIKFYNKRTNNTRAGRINAVKQQTEYSLFKISTDIDYAVSILNCDIRNSGIAWTVYKGKVFKGVIDV